MEKRALLAFAVAMLVITIWSMWLSPRPPEPQKPPVPEIQQEPEPPAPRPAPKPPTAAELSGLSKGPEQHARPEQTVTVDTPLYVAQFSSQGGRLVSWKLKDYRQTAAENAPLIDLVSLQPEGNAFPLSLGVNKEIDSAINGASYQFDKDSIVLKRSDASAHLHAIAELPSGFRLEKEMVFFADRYLMDLRVSFYDEKGRPASPTLGVFWPHTTRKQSGGRWAGFAGPVAYTDQGFKEIKDVEKFEPEGLNIKWGGYAQKYFLSAIIPLNEGRKQLFLRPTDHSVLVDVTEEVNKSNGSVFDYRIYLGPKEIKTLKAADYNLDASIDFGFFGILAKPLLYILIAVNGFTHNYGIAIIVLTIFIKLLFWPLTHKSYASMKEMQRAQPRIKQIRERFKNDKEQMNRELMLLYKTHKVNPMGGCFPMLLQIPVFFALYKTLLGSIEMRHAPFLWWIKDLAAPDYLIHFPAGINFFGIEGIGPLPLVMGGSMLAQQKMTPTMGDPMQAKLMMLMPVFFTFLFISFPSGLVLYWLINNVLSIVQQYYINSRIE
jgi:YidC/Oxa1 family membrane protein insertase